MAAVTDQDDSSNSSCGGSNNGGPSRRKGVPYIPSYMDLSNGPEPCVVCGDAATGYHYRCMTCEGCKGFFRRTIQKNLKYQCKWNNSCIIDKTTRNQCQECRFAKCITVGMAADLVLNDKQRTAKRKLIEENRQRRKLEQLRAKKNSEGCEHDDDSLTDTDSTLLEDITIAFEERLMGNRRSHSNGLSLFGVDEEKRGEASFQAGQNGHSRPSGQNGHTGQGSSNGHSAAQSETEETGGSGGMIAAIITPSIIRTVNFAKGVPGFVELEVEDQVLLLKAACLEILCLRVACRYEAEHERLFLPNGDSIHKSQTKNERFVEPLFDFAAGLSKLKLDRTEVAMLGAVLLLQTDRVGLKNPEAVERLLDSILTAFQRYLAKRRPHEPIHWAKILMKVTDLRTISTRHADDVLCVRLESDSIPQKVLEIFNEGENLPLSPPGHESRNDA